MSIAEEEGMMMPVRPVTVQTECLESFLDKLLHTVNSHGEAVSRIPSIEKSQSDLRMGLDKLALNLSSKQLMHAAVQKAPGKKLEEHESDRIKGATVLPSVATTQDISNYRASLTTIHSKRTENLLIAQKEATVGSSRTDYLHISKDLLSIRVLVSQLQMEQDDSIANSLENGRQIDVIRMDLASLHKRAAESASMSRIGDIWRSIDRNKGEIQSYVNDVERRLQSEVREDISRNHFELQNWSKEHEMLANQRQEKVRSQFASCAKRCDLDSLRQTLELETEHIWCRLDEAVESLEGTTKTVRSMQKHHALNIFHRRYSQWRESQTGRALATWSLFVQKTKEARILAVAKERLIGKVIHLKNSGAVKRGFLIWVGYVMFHRKAEAEKIKATNVILFRAKKMTTMALNCAFKQWHRLVVLDKMDEIFGPSPFSNGESATSKHHKNSKRCELDLQDSARSTERLLSLFQQDEKGALTALARQVQRLKFCDMKKLREIVTEEGNRSLLEMKESVDKSIQDIVEKGELFEQSTAEDFESIAERLSAIDDRISSNECTLNDTSAHLKNLGDNYGEKLDMLLDHKETTYDKLYDLEEALQRANNKIVTLTEEMERSNSINSVLTQRLERSESKQVQTEKNSQEAISKLEEKLNYAINLIGENSKHAETMDRAISDTNGNMERFEQESKVQFQMLSRKINAPGVRKPSLRQVVKDCIIYEVVAQEKKYVVAINSVSDGGRSLDFPDSMATFAQDYAAWIAYQADHEAVMRVVAGSNPEDFVDAEDIEFRRREMLESLRSELENIIEDAHPEPGALRIEARTKYIARLMEATDTALSKHDQVLLSTSTTIGRLNTNVPSCVACDRPLTQKGRRSRVVEGDTSDKKGRSARESINGVAPERTAASLDELHYVMRGGFKMPVARRSTAPLLEGSSNGRKLKHLQSPGKSVSKMTTARNKSDAHGNMLSSELNERNDLDDSDAFNSRMRPRPKTSHS